jgi:UDP-N-acetylglucosamine 2-epimerase
LKVCFVYSNRSEFSILEPFINHFKKKSKVSILDLSKKIKKLELDKNLYKIYQTCYTEFDSNRYDYVFILGDRRELPFIALAAFFLKIKIVHIGAGEYLVGLPTFDQIIRPIISILSNYQICLSSNAQKEVKKLFSGISNLKTTTHKVGNPVFSNINIKNLKRPIKENFDLVLLHPQSLSKEKTKKDLELLKKKISNKKTIFILGNKDENSDLINIFYKSIRNNKNYVFYENLQKKRYFSFVKFSDKFFTNSSSITEIEFLNKNALVIIGERNKDRIKHELNNKAPNELYKVLKTNSKTRKHQNQTL